MDTIKNLLSKKGRNQSKEKENTEYGSFQTGALGRFNSPSIVDIFVPNKNVTEITFRDTIKATEMLADELVYIDDKLVCLTIRNQEPFEEDIDIVEEFIGKELEEFYAECVSLEEIIRKGKIQKAITNYLFKTWKDNIENFENVVVEQEAQNDE